MSGSLHIQPKIAIVGIAAQLPSGNFSSNDLDYTSFWEFLCAEGQAYLDLKDLDIHPNPFPPETLQSLPRKAAFLKRTSEFDNIAFGISSRDARVMPFTARYLMELSFMALLDAGIESRGKPIGCFMTGNNDLGSQDHLEANGSFSYVPSAMANRISYALNITGPSFFVDTACSSSLTAFHLAVGAIERGDCSAALVGGAQSNRKLEDWKNNTYSGILAADGTSKPFSAEANGFARSEGGVVVVLKLLEDALRDNDHIYSVVVGTAINSGGSHMPIFVPSGLAYQGCIQAAYARAGKDPRDVDYYEAHATGTPVGDPNEINAAGHLFKSDRDCLIGSVKGNIGHLEMASFLVSVLKACHILDKGVIPPNVNLRKLNPNIAWEKFGLRIPTETTTLPCHSNDGRSLISISSGGHGGSFGHAVLQSAPHKSTRPPQVDLRSPVLYIVGGLTPKAVQKLCCSLVDAGRPTQDLSSCRREAVAVSRAARQCTWRSYLILTDQDSTPLSPPLPKLLPHSPNPIGFVFSGQGAQHWEMGRQLFSGCAMFREDILGMDEVYKRATGVSLLDTTGLFQLSYHSLALPPIWSVEIIVAANAMLQIALYDLLVELGVKPEFLIGHSAGETAILYASGAGPKEMAIELAIARGRAMACTELLDGGMASFACSEEAIQPLMSKLQQHHNQGDHLSVACFNAPDSISLAGPTTLVDEAVALATTSGIFSQRIRTKVPGHSPLMEFCRDDYDKFVFDVFSRYPGLHAPHIPVYSTAIPGTLITDFTAEYFWANTRNPVHFSDAVTMALQLHSPSPIIIEIAAHPVLTSAIRSCGVPMDNIVCPMRRSKSAKQLATHEFIDFFQTVGQLAMLGVNTIDLTSLYGSNDFHGLPVPYPFQRRTIPPPDTFGPARTPFSDFKLPLSPSDLMMTSTTHPLLAQHIIDGQPVLPATAFLEMILEAGANYLWDIEFRSFLPIHPHSAANIHLDQQHHTWTILSSSSDNKEAMRVHVSGNMDTSSIEENHATPLPELLDDLPPIEVEGFYQQAHTVSEFGPSFHRLVKIRGGPVRALAEVRGPSSEESSEGYVLHPATLDACIHFLAHPKISKQYTRNDKWLPSRIESFELYTRGPKSSENWVSFAELMHWAPDHRAYNVSIFSTSGNPICYIRGLILRKHLARSPRPSQVHEIILQQESITSPSPSLPLNFIHPEWEEIQKLMKILDTLALQIMGSTLIQNPTVGDQRDRQRYLQFARNATIKVPSSSPGIDPSVMTEIQRKWPVYFEVTEQVRRHHKEIFRSSSAAVQALYSDDLMSRFYAASPIQQACLILRDHFRALVSQFVDSGRRVIRILEVGAGTGLLTRYLTDYLSTLRGVVVQYVVTDISLSFSRDLAQQLPYDFILPGAYDLGRPFQDQGFSGKEFDIVVASHVLHATPNLLEALKQLRQLLVNGGSLLAIELNGSSWPSLPGSLWHDFVFGSFSEWFGFDDGRKHCTVDPLAWRDLLEAAGFPSVQMSAEAGEGLDFIFGAQASLDDGPMALSTVPMNLALQYQVGEEMNIQSQLLRLDPHTRQIVCFFARSGPDGDAASGFVASLSQEFTTWDIRLAILESENDPGTREPLKQLTSLLCAKGERVVYFPLCGGPMVRRVVPCLPITEANLEPEVSSNPNRKIRNVLIIKGALPLSPSKIMVESRSTFGNAVEVIVGRAIEGVAFNDGDTVYIVRAIGAWQDEVAAIASAPPSVLPRCFHPHHTANNLLASVIASISLTPSSSTPHILVAISSPNISDALHRALNAFTKDDVIDTDFSVFSPSRRYNIIITDLATVSQFPHIRRWLRRKGNLFVWEDEVTHLLENDVSMVQSALVSGLKRLGWHRGIDQHTVAPVSAVTGSMLTTSEDLLNPKRTYLILGGIGGLGIELALWLYRSGARHIVLTSRRGPASLVNDDLAQMKLSYLNNQDNLKLSLVQSDATSRQDMSSVLQNLSTPLAGVFILTLLLSDSLFVNQTLDSFKSVRGTKLAPLDVLSACMDFSDLDFCVSFSSMAGLVGIAGQTNYSSACTALDGAIRHYPNAFSVAVPGILDVGFLVNSSREELDYKRLAAGGITSEELFSCIRDGIVRLSNGLNVASPLIPSIDFTAVNSMTDLGLMCRHLTGGSYLAPFERPVAHTGSAYKPFDILLDLIDIPKDSFDADTPLTSYGVDSITAARISNDLRPHASISQMQIMAGVTWKQIESALCRSSSMGQARAAGSDDADALAIFLEGIGIAREDFDPEIPLLSYGIDSLVASRLARSLSPFLSVTPTQLLGATSWADLSKRFRKEDEFVATNITSSSASLPREAELIQELHGGTDVPLIVIHDMTGSILALEPLRRRYTKGPLWAIQVAQGTPLHSLSELVNYYYKKIKAKQPIGPYRLANFSGTSVLCLLLARTFEAAGEEIVQLAFIDHFPTLWTCSVYQISEAISRPTTQESEYNSIINQGIGTISALRRDDPIVASGGHVMKTLASADLAAGLYEKLLLMALRYLKGQNLVMDPAFGLRKFIESLLASVHAPTTVFVAAEGIVKTLPSEMRDEWKDLGASSSPHVRVVYSNRGHYGILDDVNVVQQLEDGWSV